jgi:molecular chaperone GrpE
MADESERAHQAQDDTTETTATDHAEHGFDPVAALEAAEAAWEAERAEMRDRLMRALAEMENVRKRGEKDRREAAMYGGAKLARDLLPVFDNLSRALALVDDDARAQMKGVVDGVELTLRELTTVMARHGVEQVSPEPGAPFDPHLHEAMFEAPVPGFAPGTVIQVVAEGFRLHDQLLRPAKVGVASRAH